MGIIEKNEAGDYKQLTSPVIKDTLILHWNAWVQFLAQAGPPFQLPVNLDPGRQQQWPE